MLRRDGELDDSRGSAPLAYGAMKGPLGSRKTPHMSVRVAFAAITFAFTLASAGAVSATPTTVTVAAGVGAPVRLLINGRPVLRTAALRRDGVDYIELGGFVRTFSGLVIYSGPTSTVSIGGRIAIFRVGSPRVNLDGVSVSAGAKTLELNGDRYVPLVFAATRLAKAKVHLTAGGTVAAITSFAQPGPSPTPDANDF
jgi:hypothetical protein